MGSADSTIPSQHLSMSRSTRQDNGPPKEMRATTMLRSDLQRSALCKYGALQISAYSLRYAASIRSLFVNFPAGVPSNSTLRWARLPFSKYFPLPGVK